jgi:teichuronic acid exporter
MKESIFSRIRKGVFWTAFFNSIDFVLTFGSSVVLARLLFPEDFGLMGLATIAIQFARRVANFGFTSVLVWLKEIKQEHYDTVYFFNLFLMSLVSIGLFFSAPYYADFFNSPQLTLIIRVISIDFVLNAFASVPYSILKRHMKFDLIGVAETISRLVTIAVSVGLAIWGVGVWSLVFGTLAGSLALRTALVSFATKRCNWKPGFKIRFWALKDTFAFGIWIYINTYIGYGVDNVDYFFIGKFLGTTQLGFYERAFRLMSLPRKRIVRVANSVLFSGYSRIQDDNDLIVKALLRVVTYLSCIGYPLMIWFYFAAPSLIPVLYGERWNPVVLPLQIMCISGLLDSFTLLFQPLLRAKGLIAHHTRRSFVYFIVLSISIILTLRWGIVGVSWAIVFSSLINLSLMLQITIANLPIRLIDFVKAQFSAIIYGSVQIGASAALLFVPSSILPIDSVFALGAVTIVSFGSLIGAHFLFRFNDVNDIILDIFTQIRKLARKIPMIKNSRFAQ